MNETLLTLVIDSLGKSVDLLLPSDLSLREVLEEVLPRLEEWGPYPFSEQDYNCFLSDGGPEWKPANLDQTLEEQKVGDGCRLRLEKRQNFSTSA
ncbi:hypothetical protein AWM70_12555 [Paenibacillus yonginensis]|uniref:Ubiquitin-like domain-containing protein n=1 Tax=Paenibacillus yonginensis TaxID=1462996 RepID=A0A1B1N1P5_9BACL|nr:hypothetical protein [Paenibacillus yonginensis]ANS75335.1 hypothetical protein AWM70_12555 [Paenibacillus yonginensis]